MCCEILFKVIPAQLQLYVQIRPCLTLKSRIPEWIHKLLLLHKSPPMFEERKVAP